MTDNNLRLSKDQLKQLSDAENELNASLEAYEKMRELLFSDVWARVGIASDEVAWAMEIRRLKTDVEKYVCGCIDLVATAARSFGALEPFRECLEEKASDIKRRAVALVIPRIDSRLRPEFEAHIFQIVSDRVSKYQEWAEQDLKPKWMTQEEPSVENAGSNLHATTEVGGAALVGNIPAGAQQGTEAAKPDRKSSPSRLEIKQYANEIFHSDIEDRSAEYAKKEDQALREASLKNNSGAYLSTLVQCKEQRVREEVLRLAAAWVEAGTAYGVALGDWAYKALEKDARLIAAGCLSSLRGQLDLRAVRTRTTRNHSGGNSEINRAVTSALRNAKLRLKAQRIAAERSTGTGTQNSDPTPGPLTKREIPAATGPKSDKRRGRPPQIPDTRKDAAARCKAEGGTNRDAAKLIYDTNYPSSQQVKNVPSILRYHRGKS